MARAILIGIGTTAANKDDTYGTRTSVTDEDTDVQVYVSDAYGAVTRHQAAQELVRLADFIDSQQISGWPL